MRLLGFSNPILKRKSQSYNPLKTSYPNQVWCADVTIFKTIDNVKHYIHILIDHFSKKVLAYSIEKNNSGKAIRNLLQHAHAKHRPNQTMFLTDGGSENINTNVSSLLLSWNDTIIHRIAQRDVLFSNSMIEAFNKVLKHQFLHHRNIASLNSLEKIVAESIPIYNNLKPQWSLGGNTPSETFDGVTIDFHQYTHAFKTQKSIRLEKNRKTNCQICH